MTLPEIVTLITASTAAMVTIINALRGRETRQQVQETHTQVGAMGVQLNGRLAQLLEASRQSAWEAGIREGHRQAQAGQPQPRVPPQEECTLV